MGLHGPFRRNQVRTDDRPQDKKTATDRRPEDKKSLRPTVDRKTRKVTADRRPEKTKIVKKLDEGRMRISTVGTQIENKVWK